MGNLISYIKENGDRTFMDLPLGPVDALILTQFSYVNFDGIVPEMSEQKPPITTKQLKEQIDRENMFAVDWFQDELKEMFELFIHAKRFRKIRMNYFVNEVEKEKETQFSAITFTLGDGNVFIAFRGTDNELIGWKEDFNMAYLTPVPSQIMAVKYVDQIADIYRRKRKARFYFGGHSKGGNLAVYAAMNCQAKLKEKIDTIYNMDGPGFRPEFFEGLDYASVKEKIRKIVPQSSMVGMIMQPDDHYEVVAGTVPGMIQHLPITWQVENQDFVYVKEVNPRRKKADDQFNQWILSMSKEDAEAFLQCMYSLVTSTNATLLKELTQKWVKNVFTMMGAYTKMDDGAKEKFWEMAGIFVHMIFVDSTEIVERMGSLQKVRELLENQKNEESNTI